MTVKELKKYLDLSERRIYQLIKQGVIEKEESGDYDLLKCLHSYINYLRMMVFKYTGSLNRPKYKRIFDNKVDLSSIDWEKIKI